MYKGLDEVFKAMFIMSIVGVVLGIWKTIDIILWIVNNVRIG